MDGGLFWTPIRRLPPFGPVAGAKDNDCPEALLAVVGAAPAKRVVGDAVSVVEENDHSRRFSLLILGISFTLLSFVYRVSWHGRQKCKSRYQFRRFLPCTLFYKMGGMRVWVSSFRAFCGVSGRDIYPGKRAKFSLGRYRSCSWLRFLCFCACPASISLWALYFTLASSSYSSFARRYSL